MAKSLTRVKLAEVVSQGISAGHGCVNVVEGVSKGDQLKCATGFAGASFSASAAAFSCGDAAKLMEWKDAAQKAEVAEGARSAMRELAQSTRQGGPNPVKTITEGKRTKSLWQAAKWGKETLAASYDKIQEVAAANAAAEGVEKKIAETAGEASLTAADLFGHTDHANANGGPSNCVAFSV